MEDGIMKRKYDKPTMRVVQLQHKTMLLAGSDKGYEVIGTGAPNQPAGSRGFDDLDDDWDE